MRRERRELRRHGRTYALAASVRLCGIKLAWSSSGASARLIVDSDGVAKFQGVLHCGSVWACPVCAGQIGQARAVEAQQVITHHLEAKGGAYLLTLTVPHNAGDALRPMRQFVACGWQAITSGAPWKRIRERYGVMGHIRALECTHGANGWHPHLHVVLLTNRWLTAPELAELEHFISERWARAALKAGYRQPHQEHGVNLQCGQNAGFYIAKLGLARELAGGAAKTGQPGHRTPMQILSDLVAHRRPRDLELWKEWQHEMRGARQLTWSKGLRELYPKKSDQEIVNADEQEPVELLHLSEPDWYSAVQRPGLLEKLLELAEAFAAEGKFDRDAREALASIVEAGIGRHLRHGAG